jgi:hypothetical protein
MHRDSEGPVSICVVLDTNIWRQEILLRSNIGAALLFEVHRQQISLGLPEVVEREIPLVLGRLGVELVDKVGGGLRQLAQVLGAAPDPSLPTAGDIQEGVRARIEELEPFLTRVPYDLEVARGALDRILDPSSPFAQREEYKDATIWEGVLRLADTFETVIFVSKDKVFAGTGSTEGSLATQLSHDMRAGEVLFFRALADCVQHLQSGDEPEVDANLVVRRVHVELEPTLQRDAERYGHQFGPLIAGRIRTFVTEDPCRLAVDFELTIELTDMGNAGRTGRAHATGDCLYEPGADAVSEVHIERVVVEIEGDDGESRRHQSIYIGSTVSLGSRTRVHRTRAPLSGEYLVVTSGDVDPSEIVWDDS